jgi:hypothetical protein
LRQAQAITCKMWYPARQSLLTMLQINAARLKQAHSYQSSRCSRRETRTH